LCTGLGNLNQANVAAETVALVVQHFGNDPIPALVKRCHRRLLMSRGVVLGLALFQREDPILSWVGFGTISGWILRGGSQPPRTVTLGAYAGVVGYHLPMFETSEHEFQADDVLVLASDGLGSSIDPNAPRLPHPQAMAERLLDSGPDELEAVLVARFKGDELGEGDLPAVEPRGRKIPTPRASKKGGTKQITK
jgi:hypothetical protein